MSELVDLIEEFAIEALQTKSSVILTFASGIAISRSGLKKKTL